MKEKLSVLIVEDLQEDVFLVVRALRSSYEIEHEQVASAEKLKKALEKPWDIVICDYSMPGFTGLDALKIVREEKPFLPFIIVSGDIGEEIAVNAMKAGAHDYVMKGNLPRLLPAIDRELREAESNRARLHAEAAMARLAAIVESSADAIIGMETNGTILSWNVGAEKIFGYSSQEARGKNLSIIAPSGKTTEMEQSLKKVQQNGQVCRYETHRIKKDGTIIDVAVTNSPIKNAGGEIIGLSSIEQDISARKKDEAERRKLYDELKEAVAKVKTLSGLLPICASCKNIRDDRGKWQHIETYIKDRSDADFSHGLCPDCMEKLYPEYLPTAPLRP